MSGELWYIDSSAAVKLVVSERESDALDAWASGRDLASSVILDVEVRRAVRRAGTTPTRLPDVLGEIDLLPLSGVLLERAALVGPPGLRSLDAIHLASAVGVGPGLGGMVCYDNRLAEASVRAGIEVLAPA